MLISCDEGYNGGVSQSFVLKVRRAFILIIRSRTSIDFVRLFKLLLFKLTFNKVPSTSKFKKDLSSISGRAFYTLLVFSGEI